MAQNGNRAPSVLPPRIAFTAALIGLPRVSVGAFTLAFALTLAPHPTAGQMSVTCGWPSTDARQVPRTLEALRERAGEVVPEWLPEAEEQLLRWYRDCDATAGHRASRSLQVLRDYRNSSDPLLLAWLGVAYVRGPEVQVPHAAGSALRSMHRLSNSERDGARLLARVLEETGWPEVGEELAGVAVAGRRGVTLRVASRALGRAVNTQPGLWSALAEVELVRGNRGAAQRAATRAVAAGSPRGMRVAGILQMLAGRDPAGSELYLRGLKLARGDQDLEPFFDDLRLLLDPDELAQWQTLQTGRAEWIQHKWEWRAHMSGVPLAQRLGVNQRRLGEALKDYSRQSFRGAPPDYAVWEYDLNAWLQPLDDRGIVFLRHGEPGTVLRKRKAGSWRMAWIYSGVDSKPMTFEFDKNVMRSDYFLAEPPPCYPPAPDPRSPPRRPAISDWGLSLAAYDAGLGWYYIRCEWNPESGILGYGEARETARRTAKAAWHTESGVAGFSQPLATHWNLYAFQAPAGPELVGYLSIVADSIRPAPRRATQPIDLGVLFSVGDPVTESITQLDTSLAFTPTTPLPRGATLHWVLPIRAPANDNARVTMTVRNRADGAQGRVSSTTWRLPAFDGTLLLSDLVVAELRPGILRRGSHRIAPLPGHAVLEDTPFRLYYELYGAHADDPVSVTIRIVPGQDQSLLARLKELISSRDAFSLEFDELAAPEPDGVVRMERDIEADLAPGAYIMVVRVHDRRTNALTVAETNLVVVER